MSSRILLLPVFCVGLLVVLPAFSGDKKDDKVAFEVYAKGYFVKKKAPITDNPAYVLLKDKKAFDEIFGFGAVMKVKPKLVDEKVFETNVIVSVIKSGNALTNYEVEQVTREKNKLVVKYKTSDKGATTAQFRSPLILALPRADVTEIVLVENGKEVRKLEVKK